MKSPRITNSNIKLSTIITPSPFTIYPPSFTKAVQVFPTHPTPTHFYFSALFASGKGDTSIFISSNFNTFIMENMLTHKLINDLIFLIIFTTYRTIQLFVRVFIIYFLNHVFLFKWSTFFQFLLYFSLPN